MCLKRKRLLKAATRNLRVDPLESAASRVSLERSQPRLKRVRLARAEATIGEGGDAFCTRGYVVG